MTNKVVREKLICANFMVEKLRFFKKKPNKKSGRNKINPKLFIY